jgi:hypothetical protein
MTECEQETLRFQEISGKRVEAKFDRGMVSTEAGALILREICKKHRMFERLKDRFTDYRNPALTTDSPVTQGTVVSRRTKCPVVKKK